MSTLTLAAKDFRLLRRDYRSAVILLATPLVFVAVLSVVVGEGFGQKPDDRLRISVVNEDDGLPPEAGPFPTKPWSQVVLDDLAGSTDIRIELIESRAEAERLVRDGKRSAVLVFEPDFSARMHRCSFLTHATPEPLNPLFRDGINPAEVGLSIKRDPTQQAGSSIIEQVAQVSLFRVVIPWMIGKAFERVGDEQFMQIVAAKLEEKKEIPAPVLKELDPVLQRLLKQTFADPKFDELSKKKFKALAGLIKPQIPTFQELFKELFQDDEFLARVGQGIPFGQVLQPSVQREVGPRVQDTVAETFSNYNFKAKTWAGLTKSDPKMERLDAMSKYESEGGLPKRGSLRFQILVPSYAVTFAFFLVLTVGWMFVGERRQGTLVRLRAAPLTRGQLLLGKFLPAMGVSLFQGVFLMAAGKLVFGLSWGTSPLVLLIVVAATAFAATGLAMLVASVAKTETQVAVYGTLLVLVLAGIGGSMMPRDLMPETMRQISHITPHAWALDAYQQLLLNPDPNLGIVAGACAALVGFGAGFLGLAWKLMRVD
ncbi:MAG TPA: ABC transporter permease [Gemmataceae bacterium]|jgi:ABC-type Na+ efflux pump permease subunit|nr:ABC transporter permease [Gemmataceae bacterium]